MWTLRLAVTSQCRSTDRVTELRAEATKSMNIIQYRVDATVLESRSLQHMRFMKVASTVWPQWGIFVRVVQGRLRLRSMALAMGLSSSGCVLAPFAV